MDVYHEYHWISVCHRCFNTKNNHNPLVILYPLIIHDTQCIVQHLCRLCPFTIWFVPCMLFSSFLGVAIRNVLYNSEALANPAGRLPMTWPKTLDGVRFFYYELNQCVLFYLYFVNISKHWFRNVQFNHNSLFQFPAITNYSMQGRTYRYADNNVFYPFGYGLSYSKFR